MTDEAFNHVLSFYESKKEENKKQKNKQNKKKTKKAASHHVIWIDWNRKNMVKVRLYFAVLIYVCMTRLIFVQNSKTIISIQSQSYNRGRLIQTRTWKYKLKVKKWLEAQTSPRKARKFI